MGFNIRKLIIELKKRKQGIIVGGLVGAYAAYYAIDQGMDISTLASAGKGLLDTLMSRSAPLEIAQSKIYLGFTSIGATAGYIVDVLSDMFPFTRKRR